MTKISGTSSVELTGKITDADISSNAALTRAKCAQEDLAVFPILLTEGKVWDAAATDLPAAGANDDLGIYTGTPGTNSVYLGTGDVKAAGCTRKAGYRKALPECYVAGQTVYIRISGGMITTVSDGACTVDVSAYESDRVTGVGADLVTTAATSIKSLTFADKDFVLTATDLAPGDVLEIIITIAVTDAATASAVIGAIGAIELLCDIKG